MSISKIVVLCQVVSMFSLISIYTVSREGLLLIPIALSIIALALYAVIYFMEKKQIPRVLQKIPQLNSVKKLDLGNCQYN